jgi:hypothetical protein
MEVLIFGAVSIIGLAAFIGLTLLPFLVAERLGFKIGRLTRQVTLRWLLPVALLLAAFAWVLSGYLTFKRACQTIPKVEFLGPPSTPPSGFKLYGDSSTSMGYPFSWGAVLETGTFQFVDMAGGRRCVGPKAHPRSPKFPTTLQCTQHSPTMSEFAVHAIAAQPVHYWWSPPIFVSELRVEEMKSGNVIARATDLVYGGGFTGMYLRLFGGDQDYERLSCGYASSSIGPWRPSLTSRPRFSEYEAADVAFVAKALGVRQ